MISETDYRQLRKPKPKTTLKVEAIHHSLVDFKTKKTNNEMTVSWNIGPNKFKKVPFQMVDTSLASTK